MTISLGYKNISLFGLFLERVKTAGGERDREKINADTNWRRIAILTHNFLITFIPYFGPP